MFFIHVIHSSKQNILDSLLEDFKLKGYSIHEGKNNSTTSTQVSKYLETIGLQKELFLLNEEININIFKSSKEQKIKFVKPRLNIVEYREFDTETNTLYNEYIQNIDMINYIEMLFQWGMFEKSKQLIQFLNTPKSDLKSIGIISN